MTTTLPSSQKLASDAVELRVLGSDDIAAAATMLARGFAAEPGSVAMFPDPAVRTQVFELSITGALHAAVPHASVHGVEVDGELGGVALWHPPGVTGTDLATRLRAVPSFVGALPVLASQVPHLATQVRRHAREALPLVRSRARAVRSASRGATWHLAFLATDPAFRGRGLARLLLDHVLDRCDDDGLAAWLETTDPVNPPIYERFGFETIAHVEQAAWLPGFWVMRREPR
jgi:ribosomal protein S18 acetylase RimI-like enzyme